MARYELCEQCGRMVAVQPVVVREKGERSMHRVGVCEGCGRTGRRVSKHHLLPRDRAGTDEPENLMDLCDSCHNYVEVAEPLPTTRERVLALLAAREDDVPAVRIAPDPWKTPRPEPTGRVPFDATLIRPKHSRPKLRAFSRHEFLGLLTPAERGRLGRSFPKLPAGSTNVVVTEAGRCASCGQAIFYVSRADLWFHAAFLLGLLPSSRHVIRPSPGSRGLIPVQNATTGPERAKTGGQPVQTTEEAEESHATR